mmetsp:Transcript_23589/g.50039  ORF Transcript_23589/g.50039 Transcript_23589/m.50039 type:complete len:404 (-) Transcript_23589:37-1248(-)
MQCRFETTRGGGRGEGEVTGPSSDLNVGMSFPEFQGRMDDGTEGEGGEGPVVVEVEEGFVAGGEEGVVPVEEVVGEAVFEGVEDAEWVGGVVVSSEELLGEYLGGGVGIGGVGIGGVGIGVVGVGIIVVIILVVVIIIIVIITARNSLQIRPRSIPNENQFRETLPRPRFGEQTRRGHFGKSISVVRQEDRRVGLDVAGFAGREGAGVRVAIGLVMIIAVCIVVYVGYRGVRANCAISMFVGMWMAQPLLNGRRDASLGQKRTSRRRHRFFDHRRLRSISQRMTLGQTPFGSLSDRFENFNFGAFLFLIMESVFAKSCFLRRRRRRQCIRRGRRRGRRPGIPLHPIAQQPRHPRGLPETLPPLLPNTVRAVVAVAREAEEGHFDVAESDGVGDGVAVRGTLVP